MIFLRKATASQEVLLGPFLDDTDGKTAETALSIANTDIKLWKRGGTTEASKNSGGATHIASGRYYAVLDATDTDTVGELVLNVAVAGALPVRLVCCVLEAAVFDQLVASGATGDPAGVTTLLGRLTSDRAGYLDNINNANLALVPGFPSNFALLGINASGHVSRVVLCDLLTTYVGNTPQTGDAFARIGAAGAGLTSLAPAATALSSATWTNALAGYVANLNVGGAVASQADINALNQSASRRIILTTVQQYERPESSTSSYTIEARTYDGDGAAVNADATPTLTATGIVTGSLAANLSSATNPATGVYRWTYTVSSTATIEQIRFDVAATLSAGAFGLSVYAQVVDQVSQTWTSTHASQLAAIYNKLPSKSTLAGTNNSDGDVQLDEATGTPANSAGVGTLLTRVTGPVLLAADYVPSGDATAANQTTMINHLTAMKGAGFSGSTDSLEAISDAVAGLAVSSGSGAYTITITVNDGTTALQGATVRVTEGVTTITGTTNASGVVVFALDAAAWSLAITKPGYSYTPTTLTVSGTASFTRSMTAVSIDPPAGPGLSTGTIICYGTDGLPESGAKVYVRLVSGPGDAGAALDGGELTLTANGSGVATHTGFVRGGAYKARRGTAGTWVSFTVPDADSFDISELVGSPYAPPPGF